MRSKFSSLWPGDRSIERGSDAVHANSLGRERPRGQFGESGQGLLGQGVAQKIGVGRGELGVQQIDDKRCQQPGVCARAKAAVNRIGARRLTAMCASSSAGSNSDRSS